MTPKRSSADPTREHGDGLNVATRFANFARTTPRTLSWESRMSEARAGSGQGVAVIAVGDEDCFMVEDTKQLLHGRLAEFFQNSDER